MCGYIEGFSDTGKIKYCPACGERVFEFYADGTCRCDACGTRFGVVEMEEEEE
jgi:uncharacterized Zn finger protein (UPF0148 family)